MSFLHHGLKTAVNKPVGGGLAHGDGGVEDVAAAVAALLEDLHDGLDSDVGGGVGLQLGDDPPHSVEVALQDLGEQEE